MMNPDLTTLSVALRVIATLQLGIAILNLFLVRIFDWKTDLQRMPLLLREVHMVHAWFISVSLAIFALMTWHFAGELARGIEPMARWLAGCIGAFWAIRTVLQVTYYSSSHWRGRPGRTFAHVLLLTLYGGFASTYLWAALREVT